MQKVRGRVQLVAAWRKQERHSGGSEQLELSMCILYVLPTLAPGRIRDTCPGLIWCTLTADAAIWAGLDACDQQCFKREGQKGCKRDGGLLRGCTYLGLFDTVLRRTLAHSGWLCTHQQWRQGKTCSCQQERMASGCMSSAQGPT